MMQLCGVFFSSSCFARIRTRERATRRSLCRGSRGDTCRRCRMRSRARLPARRASLLSCDRAKTPQPIFRSELSPSSMIQTIERIEQHLRSDTNCPACTLTQVWPPFLFRDSCSGMSTAAEQRRDVGPDRFVIDARITARSIGARGEKWGATKRCTHCLGRRDRVRARHSALKSMYGRLGMQLETSRTIFTTRPLSGKKEEVDRTVSIDPSMRSNLSLRDSPRFSHSFRMRLPSCACLVSTSPRDLIPSMYVSVGLVYLPVLRAAIAASL